MNGHGLGGYSSDNGYWKLEHEWDDTKHPGPNDRVVVKLYDNSEGGYPFKGFILKTSAGTLTAKSSHAAAVSACTGAIGHTESSGKTVAEAYLDLPSSEGTVTVTAEVVYSKTWVAALTLDIEVVAARATGGTITAFGDYVIHNFTSSGIFTVTDSSLTEVEVLVVGGGGGSGWHGYGGGGGGGLFCTLRTKRCRRVRSLSGQSHCRQRRTGSGSLSWRPMVAPAPLTAWWQTA